jgi:hypothetical protein
VRSKQTIPPQSGAVRLTIMNAIMEYGIIIFIQIFRKEYGKKTRRAREEIKYGRDLYKGTITP